MANETYEVRIQRNEREIEELRIKIGVILTHQNELHILQRETQTKLELYEKHQEEDNIRIMNAISEVNVNVGILTADLKQQKEISDKRSGATAMAAWAIAMALTLSGLVATFWNTLFGK